MDQVITFDKTFQERLKEYLDVLSNYDVLPVSQIQKVWSYYLELTLDPSGWQAVWKIPRLKCESLKIPFPTIVLVYVENIDPQTLSAFVKILAVQDDISLPEKHSVPLIQLWPTKEQDPTIALNLQMTANVIDILRFFYQNIFMPWDMEDDDTSDWLSKHLECRLRLYYDIKNGVIPRNTADHLKALISEAKRLQAQKEQIENDLGNEDVDLDNMDCSRMVENEKLKGLMKLHVRILQISAEVKLLENPLIRNVILGQQKEFMPAKQSEYPEIWLIIRMGRVDDYLEVLNSVKESYPKDVVKLSNR